MNDGARPVEKPANNLPPGMGGSFYNGGYGYMPGSGMYGGPGMMMLPPGMEEPETIIVTKLFSSRRDLDRMASGIDFPHQYHSGWDLYNSLGSPKSDSFYGRNYSTNVLDAKDGGTATRAGTTKGVGATGGDAEGTVRGSSAEKQKATHATSTNGVATAHGGVKPTADGRHAAVAHGAPASASNALWSADARHRSVQPQTSLASGEAASNSGSVSSRSVSPDAATDYDLYAQRRRTSRNSATDVSHNPGSGAQWSDNLRAGQQPSANLDDIPQLRSDYVASGSAYGRLESSTQDMLGGSTMNPSANMSLIHNEYSAPDVTQKVKPLSATEFHASRPAGSLTQIQPAAALSAEHKEPRRPSATKERAEKPREEATESRPSRLSNFASSTTMLADGATNNANSLYDAMPPSVIQSRPQSVQLMKEFAGPATSAKREGAGEAAKEPAATPAHARSASRRASRPVSRLTSMSVIDFPQGEEVADEVGQTGLGDSQQMREAEERKNRLESARAEARTLRQKEREAKRAAEEAAQRQREALQKERREQRAKEEQLRRDAVAALDEERRERHAAELAAREQQREAEKRRFLEATKAEEEREAQRVKAILEERQRRLAEEGATGEGARGGAEAASGAEAVPSRTGAASRPRSRLRPPSRPASVLRGAIPEQPPDVVGGQIEDTLADELATAKEKTAAHSHQRHETSSGTTKKKSAPVPAALPPSPPAMPIVGGGATPGAEPPVTAKASPQVASAQLRPLTPKTPNAAAESKTPTSTALAASSTAKEASRKAANQVRTIVLMDESELGSTPLRHEVGTTTVQYNNNEPCTVTTIVPTLTQAKLLQDVQKAACEGYNTAILGAEAPFSTTRFDSPVWESLVELVGQLLRANSDGEGKLAANFDITCALGYVLKEQVKDLFSEDDASPFENVSVHPSPIYGPRIKQLVYSQVTSLEAFRTYLYAALSRARANPMVSTLAEGVVVAFVLVKQTRTVKDTQDVFLSSIVVAAAGTDPVPYESACSRARNVYGAVFHLVLGGPCLTCFVLDANVSPRKLEGDAAARESFDALYKLTQGLSSFENYSLRSGSVRRFIRYVEQAQNQVKERLLSETDEAQRKKLERYKAEQQRLLDSAHKMLDEASYSNADEL